MKGMLVRFGGLCAMLLALAGCDAIGALNSASTARDVFEVRSPATTPRARAAQGVQFVVEVPTASGAVDTDRILIRPSASQVQYLADAQWTQAAPVMLQTALVETFLKTGAFRYVGAQPLGALGDLALVTHLSDFGVEATPDGGVVVMSVVANLVREEDASILSSRRFARRVPIPDTSTESIIAGFESVSAAVLTDMANWVLSARGIGRTS